MGLTGPLKGKKNQIVSQNNTLYVIYKKQTKTNCFRKAANEERGKDVVEKWEETLERKVY